MTYDHCMAFARSTLTAVIVYGVLGIESDACFIASMVTWGAFLLFMVWAGRLAEAVELPRAKVRR